MTDADPGEVLATMPDPVWPALLAAVRKAADRLGRAQLPVPLQPYAGFSPAKLGAGRARSTVAAAVAEDARLRDAIGQALAEPLWREAAEAEVGQLVAHHGPAAAAAALTARARWADVRALSVQVSAAAPATRPADSDTANSKPPAATGKAELTAMRRERDAAERGRAAAERRASDLANQITALRTRITELTAERDDVTSRADAEAGRLRDRLARLQRRVTEAEAQARADRQRLTDLAADLDRLAAGVRQGGRAPEPVRRPASTSAVAAEAPTPAVPRGVTAATPGRPCVLPPGLVDTQPAAVLALLAVPALELIVDGYNVTKDLRGVPAATLPDQRAWLVRIAAAVSASRDLRATVVFDGEGERTSSAASARVVRCVFTAEAETADDRIVDLVADLPPAAPVLVVTSDREVRERVEEFGANVVASGVFLQAVG